MIYLISDNYFKSKFAKLVKPKDYWCLDASTWYMESDFSNRSHYMKSRDGVILDPDYVENSPASSIFKIYNKSIQCTELSVPSEIASVLRDYDDGNRYDEDKYSLYMKKYLYREEFRIGLIKAIKIMSYPIITKKDSEEYNVFIAFPDIVYKYCISEIYNHMINLINVNFKWLYTQEMIKKDKSILEYSMDMDDVKELFMIARTEEANIIRELKEQGDEYIR